MIQTMNILEVNNLCKSYKGKKVLEGVSFSIKPSEIVGFIGPNGAGKTTTMKCISNLIFPDYGEIVIDGYDLKKQRIKALSSLAAVIENPGLFLDLTGRENIKMIAELKGISLDRINEIIDFVGIGANIDKKTMNYSMGMKQRLGLGIAIIGKPKLLILDEPTNGLDPSGVMKLRNTLKNLVEHEGMSILFSSHHLGEVEKLANRIIFIEKGMINEVSKEIYSNCRYLLRCNNASKVLAIISAGKPNVNVEKISDETISIEISSEREFNNIINYIAVNADIELYDIVKESIEVETIYKNIYGENYE
ncbi:MAG: ABC transporter ATP-binding protein [Firmicutes bacterium]|nr:ABC transporter ATP-binding protein [Bacillota bacterium]